MTEDEGRLVWKTAAAVLHRQGMDREDVEDGAAETVLRLLKGEWAATARNLQTLAHVVALNWRRDRIRMAIRERAFRTRWARERPASHETRPLERVILDEALAKLSPRDRALLRAWGEGLDYPALSAVSEIPINSMCTTLTRARARLRAAS
jgi:RNA polymerase sigma factor (sigma-70 family)